jgi:hypothetical protein
LLDIKSFFDSLESLLGLVGKGQGVRDKLIEDANSLAAAMMFCAGHTVTRLNEALRETRKTEKISLLNGLTNLEIEGYSRILGQCAPIRSAANSLSGHWMTSQVMNVNINGKSEALRILKTLETGENGLGQVFSEMLQKPALFDGQSVEQIDAWTLRTKDRIQGLWRAASLLASRLAVLV